MLIYYIWNEINFAHSKLFKLVIHTISIHSSMKKLILSSLKSFNFCLIWYRYFSIQLNHTQFFKAILHIRSTQLKVSMDTYWNLEYLPIILKRWSNWYSRYLCLTTSKKHKYQLDACTNCLWLRLRLWLWLCGSVWRLVNSRGEMINARASTHARSRPIPRPILQLRFRAFGRTRPRLEYFKKHKRQGPRQQYCRESANPLQSLMILLLRSRFAEYRDKLEKFQGSLVVVYRHASSSNRSTGNSISLSKFRDWRGLINSSIYGFLFFINWSSSYKWQRL